MKKTDITRCLRTLVFAVAAFLACNATQAQNYTMTNLWSIAAGTQNWLASSGNTERGMALNSTTGHLLVVSRASGNRIVILNAADGSSNNLLNISGIITSGTSVTFALNKIGVADDGVIYACDLSSASAGVTNNFIVYRWANESAAPTIAFQGSLANTGTRFGDSFAVRGSGTSTMIAAGMNTGTSIGVLTTTDGMNFTAANMTNSSATSGDYQPGLDFYGTSNLFTHHSGATSFHYSGFNLTVVPPTLQEYTTNIFSATGYGPLKSETSSNWLFSLQTTTSTAGTGHYVSLFSVSATAPVGTLTYVTSNSIIATAGGGNGNLTGEVAANGSNIYVLDTDNAIEAFAVLPVTVITPASATVSPTAQTEYVSNPGFTFTANAAGSLPISYQWYIVTNNITNAISGATNSTYSFGPATTNMTGSYFVTVSNAAGPSSSALSTLTVQTPATTGRMTNIWSITPGSRYYMDSASYTQRGLAYDPITGDVIIASRNPTNLLAVVNGTTGADKWVMNVDPTVIGTANVTYPLNVIGVGGDGVVYGAPLVVAGNTGFTLYVWNDDTPASEPQKLYIGDPGQGSLQRWGDNMAVTGSGGSTMILMASGTTTNQVCVFTTPDGGYSFNPQTLTVTDPNNASLVGFAQLGIAWGGSNTFWAKSISYNLRLVQYDLNAGTATVLNNYSTPTQGSQATALGFDPNTSLLAMLAFDAPNSVRLYDTYYTLQNYNVSPIMVDQQLFSVNNSFANYTGAVAFGDPYLYVLDSNNGLEAYQFDTSTLAPFSTYPPQIVGGTNTVVSFHSQPGRVYQVQETPTVGIALTNDGAPFASSTNVTSFVDTNTPGTANFFNVVGH